ncbi:MAG: hypothetical protein EOM87_05595 [Clostridia bacterium]|nr:hypothetical protein [Clostridia bacterium]
MRSLREEKHQKKRLREEKRQNAIKEPSVIIKANPMVSRIINIMNRFDAVAIICTTPESLKLSIYARKILESNFKIFGQVSDFALDAAFIRYEADGYFVENEECRYILEKNGIDKDKIFITGMPVLENKNIHNKDDIRKKYGFNDNLPIVVANGGVYETDTIREELIALMYSREKYNMLIITGNDKVRRKYMNTAEFSAGVVFSETFEEDMMTIADILITVPDSKVIFSAFRYGVAVIASPHITVKERDIRKYLVKRALVLPVKNPAEMIAAIDELLVETDRKKEFAMRGIKYSTLSINDSINKKSALQLNKSNNNTQLK